jgi:hypothetical protein
LKHENVIDAFLDHVIIGTAASVEVCLEGNKNTELPFCKSRIVTTPELNLCWNESERSQCEHVQAFAAMLCLQMRIDWLQ